MAANVLRNGAGHVHVLESVLPPVAVTGGLGKEISEAWYTRAKVAREGDFSGTNGV